MNTIERVEHKSVVIVGRCISVSEASAQFAFKGTVQGRRVNMVSISTKDAATLFTRNEDYMAAIDSVVINGTILQSSKLLRSRSIHDCRE